MIANDVLRVLRGTFLNGDWISLLIAFGAVLVATMAMRRATQISSMTLLALTLYAIGGYLRGVFAGATPDSGAVTGGRLVAQLETSWGIFMGLTAATLLAYFLAFMLLIFILFGVRSIFGRG